MESQFGNKLIWEEEKNECSFRQHAYYENDNKPILDQNPTTIKEHVSRWLLSSLSQSCHSAETAVLKWDTFK